MEWKSLTKKQKLARLEKQLEDIKNAQTLLDEFTRLTTDWIKKVKTLNPDEAAK
jgi:hypothetical protein